MKTQRLISIPKIDLESLEVTIETLQSKEAMEQLENSEEDIIEGRVRNARKLLKEF
jgi:PHD/YefM family antitoxin component YafN of YafNO toxin-antitoxin module